MTRGLPVLEAVEFFPGSKGSLTRGKIDEDIAEVREHGKALEVMGHVNEVVVVFETVHVQQIHVGNKRGSIQKGTRLLCQPRLANIRQGRRGWIGVLAATMHVACFVICLKRRPERADPLSHLIRHLYER